MKVQVTQEDIDNGLPCSPYDCPIARRVRSVIEATFFDDVRVEETRLFINDEAFILPRTAQRFIEDFDDDKPVAPFEFDVEGL